MTITLEITSELEEALRRSAERSGLSPDDYVLKAIEERLGGKSDCRPTCREKRPGCFSRSTRGCRPRHGRATRR